ncbi:MAG: hypothetical protein A2V85_11745 [Chloroflexi bacterium RBG_16_72_14]|nr:MAG: hypothetical protein A2V85_11745 [Chloroflexi bacterium RBG_16_72_14]
MRVSTRVTPAAGLAAAGPALLLAAAMLPDLRPLVAVLLGAGWVALRASRRPGAIAWAAVLPVGLVMAWPWVLGADAPLGEAGCTDPLSVIALRRVVAGAVILAIVAAIARAHGSTRAELGIARLGVGEGLVAAGGLVALVVGGLVIGPLVARPFFGPLDFPVPPAALVPAVGFGVANGVLEELTYRGVMQAWLGRLVPMTAAIATQALVFGIVHAGPEVVALLPVHVALLTAVGAAGGWVRWRTGSLAIPIGIHVGADIALYVGLACRAPG